MKNVFTATRQLAFVEKLFAQAGLKLDDFLASGDDSALQAHLATLAAPAVAAPAAPAAAVDTAALDSAKAELLSAQGRLTAAEQQFAAASAELTAIKAGLAAASVKVSPAAGASALTAADVTAAVEGRISVKVAELNGRLGEPPVAAQITNQPATAPKTSLTSATGLARVQATFAARLGRN
jgi:hypothetical protein